MTGYLSFLANKLVKVIAPNSVDTIEEQITKTWQEVCECSLKDTPESRSELHSKCMELIDQLRFACEENQIEKLNSIFENHRILEKLVMFGVANVPKGFIDEIVPIFIEFTMSPLCVFMNRQVIYQPLNSLFEKKDLVDPVLFEELVKAVFEYLFKRPDEISNFVVSETSSPLIDELAAMIPTMYTRLGEWVLQLIATSLGSEKLLTFLTSHSKLVSYCISYLRSCVDGRTQDPRKQKFLVYLDFSLNLAPPQFVASFCSMLQEEVISPMVLEAPTESALRNAIYILTIFSSLNVTDSVIRFIVESAPSNLSSEDETVVYLAIRSLTLALDHSKPSFPGVPQGVKTVQDVISMVPAEWFDKMEAHAYLENERSHVAAMLSSERTVRTGPEISIPPLMPDLLRIFDRFMENDVKVNLAITEFFEYMSVQCLPEVDTLLFGEDYPDGFFKVLGNVCTTAKMRVGMKEGTQENIAKAHQDLENGTEGGDPLFVAIVLLIEFLKELNCAIQSKTMLTKRDALAIE